MNAIKNANSVYTIIDQIRAKKKLSLRQLAILANIPVTTLTTIMSRRSGRVSTAFLQKIMPLLGVEDWRELYGSRGYQYELEGEDERITSDIPEDEFPEIMNRLIEKVEKQPKYGYRMGADGKVSFLTEDSSFECDVVDKQYRTTINLMLDQLNGKGLLEIMEHAIHLAKDPYYKKE